MNLVNKSVADGETVVGVPAKPIIKNRAFVIVFSLFYGLYGKFI